MDRRVQRTQESLKTAFTTLLGEYDFDDLSVKMITENANVGRKTFYLHYLDKYDLMDAVIDEYFEELADACKLDKPLEYVDKTKIWFDFFDERRSVFKKLFLSKGSYSFRDKFLKFTSNELIKKSDFKPSEDFNIKIRFLSCGVIGIIESFVLGTITQDVSKLSEQIAELIYGNLGLKVPRS
ncbi:TetR family transcriptional regulator [Lentilactobacillus curieae]|uniref:TetR family transcriptional regulator n=2 Tax=Lentilactobacillus curieae TaxID=1138822 RepID=A0A1S6QL17_9LACO|nr:TetR family transcriptional regulator [Lentilactobacillus curieae]